MKELNKTKAYDLRDLNDEQRKELLSYMRSNFKNWNNATNFFNDCLINIKCRWYQGYLSEIEERELVSGKTLFEPQLKIGDTFEHEGFICEVKEPVKKWYVVDRDLDAYYIRLSEDEALWGRTEDIRIELITDQEFIKQLEKHAR